VTSGDDKRLTSGPRAAVLDAARGIAVIAMVIYHFSWDLSHFGYIDADVAFDAGWRLFAQTIAASFLSISGVALAFATRGGVDLAAFGKRLALIGGAAALVTVGTWYAFPDRYIFFGILHCIAVTSVIALGVSRLPAPVILAAAAASFAMPMIATSDVFDAPLLIWTGLAVRVPQTNDFVPLFPWLGFVLAGLAAGRWLVTRRLVAGGVVTGGLARLGSWSLPIYLVHQPLLFALFLGVSQLGLRSGGADVRRFVQACSQQCTLGGTQMALCRQTCACTAQELHDKPIWPHMMADQLSDDEQKTLDQTGRACFETALKRGDFSAKP
jgi:uncharacterized membrane protein